jgi:hypothetical protein
MILEAIDKPQVSETDAPIVTFIVPVRHQDNSKDWPALIARLMQTVQSIAAQTHASWRGLVVANVGAQIPPLPDGFEVVRVTYPPNQLHDLGAGDKEAMYEAFRLDKGRRVLSGMIAAGQTGYFMIVDDDDFVSRDIVAHAARNYGANGWTIENGFIWSEGGRLAFLHSHFATFCGTSHVIRSDLYSVPASVAEADEDYIKTMLGSHVRIEAILEAQGFALEPLPFPGAIYRVGHAGAHSKSRGMIRNFVINKSTLRSPALLLNNVSKLRFVSRSLADAFGMSL